MTNQPNEQPTHYIGIGASAGGLEALEQFFQAMPGESGLAFIVVQHLSPDYKSMMVELLSKKTEMTVLRAEEGMAVQRNTIYLIPPKKNLTIFHGKLLLSDQPPHDRWINLPIDIFFSSLAEDQGEKAVGIILSGTGSDGSRGVRAIKEFGGMIMVQHAEEARFDGMPKSATSTGIADFVLKVSDMPAKLLNYVRYPTLTKAGQPEKLVESEDGLAAIFSMIRSKTKVDFTCYKPSTVIRRIERRMNLNQIESLDAYITLLKENNRELTTLYRELLIGVTKFFRDREAYDLLAEQYLPELLQRKQGQPIRIWVAGCSTGEEAYSLSILLMELIGGADQKAPFKVFATDVDNEAILLAGTGVYSESIAADVGQPLLAKYLHHRGDNYHIARKVRETVVFAQHNLIRDPPFTNIDLISCRNLLIYLQPNLQKRALELFNFSLNPEGILFLGSSETTGEMSGFFTALHHKWKIYRSKGQRRAIFTHSPPAPLFSGRKPPVVGPLQDFQGERRYQDGERRISERLLRTLAEDIIPLTVVVNEEMEVLYTIGDTGDYFRLPYGRMDNDIRKMLQKEMAIPLSIGIQKVFKENREITYGNIRLHDETGSRNIRVTIRPLAPIRSQHPLVVLLFREPEKPAEAGNGEAAQSYDYDREAEQRIFDLEQELQFTKENLQATIEELETSNEELQATNEELLASNEELQSTNEELQSVNEELYTVNSEHQGKIIELTELNNDIDNLLNGIQIGTLFLDEEMRVRKFTPQIQQVFNIIEGDIGRPLGHLTNTILDLDLPQTVKSVMDSGRAADRKIQVQGGRWMLLRILPYSVAPNLFAGVVLTLIDISDLVQTEDALAASEAQLGLAERIAQFASWRWDIGTGTLEFSAGLESIFGYVTQGFKPTFEAFLESVHPDDRQEFIDQITQAVENGRDFDLTHRVLWPDGTVRLVRQVGIASLGSQKKAARMTGITIDITDGDGLSEAARNKNSPLRTSPDTVAQGLIVIDEQGRIETINSKVATMLGYKADELIGADIAVLMPEPHRSNHPGYIRRYLETGERRIIGKGKQVQAVCKDGSLLEVSLSVGEIRIGNHSLFSAILQQS